MPRAPKPRPPVLTNFELYELAVTNPGPMCRFLAAAWRDQQLRTRRASPTLREDFSGSGALARAWAAQIGLAIAVDKDAKAIKACGRHEQFAAIQADVMECTAKADVIAATNFAAGYWHERLDLLAYLRHARMHLNSRGIFCCDLYGGSDAFHPCVTKVPLRGPGGEKIEYHWEQVAAYPQISRVENAIHFKVGKRPLIRNAFTYDWRLWSIAEMRDCMLEAGFSQVRIFDRLGDAVDGEGNLFIRELGPREEMDDPFVVYVVASR